MTKMLLSVVMSLVPLRYRGAWFHDVDVDVKRGAMLSGVIQGFGGAVLIYVRYLLYLIHRQEMLEKMAGAKTEYDQIALAYRGVTVLTFVEYLLLPVTMLLFYVTIEGAFRMVAAIAAGEILPTMPLAVVSMIHGALSKRHAEHKLGPRVSDQIIVGTSPEFDLRIDSCRPKEWTKLTTIQYNDELYEMVKQFSGAPPRPHIYMLKRSPAGKIVRGIYRYHPDEVLPENQKAEYELP